jgi:nucleotidyltransferase substrate binding protein (TIGR01987 family)
VELDLSPYLKVLNALTRALDEYKNNPNEFVKDSCIKRFKATYELSYKSIKRYLELIEPNLNKIETMSFQELIKLAYGKGLLLNDWEKWENYRFSISQVSYTYEDKVANEVFNDISGFVEEVKFIYNKITVN